MGLRTTSSGIAKQAFNPLIAATEAWLEAGDVPADPPSLEQLARACFPENLLPGYVTRFLTFEVRKPVHPPVKTRMAEHLVVQAFVEAEAALRKIAVHTTPRIEFDSDDKFEQVPQYVTARGGFERLEFDIGNLTSLDLSRCPKCTIIAETETWLGHRSMGGKTIPQSWCRICRALDSARADDSESID
jgi:hypothetical protein